jgi:succinate dehydrogenase hydrophobic anchor subunit
MTAIANTDTAPPHRWLRVVLVLIAALEFLDALSGVQNIFTDYPHPTAFLRFAQTLTSIKLALAPVIAGAALIYAALGNVRHAILALAALEITT